MKNVIGLLIVLIICNTNTLFVDAAIEKNVSSLLYTENTTCKIFPCFVRQKDSLSSLDQSCVFDFVSQPYAEFNDLNTDCKLLILDELNLSGLISIADINQEFHLLAVGIYRRKFARKAIYIGKPTEYLSNLQWSIKELDNAIEINSQHTSIKLLEYFGHLISKLSIYHDDRTSSNTEMIVALASRNCIKLTTFEVDINYICTLFDHVEKPFANVENVTIKCGICNLASKTLTLNEIFPSMRHMSLNVIRLRDPKSIELNYQNLTQLSISYIFYQQNYVLNVEKMLRLNPQISSLKLFDSMFKFLKFASENLPNLAHLDIGHIQRSVGDGDIHFGNVLSLTLRSGIGNFAQVATFDRLHEITIDYARHLPEWTDLMKGHSTVQKLIVLDGNLSDTDILLLEENLPNLVEASFALPPATTEQLVLHILRGFPKLKRFELTFYGNQKLTNESVNAITNQIENEWNITITYYAIFIEK